MRENATSHHTCYFQCGKLYVREQSIDWHFWIFHPEMEKLVDLALWRVSNVCVAAAKRPSRLFYTRQCKLFFYPVSQVRMALVESDNIYSLASDIWTLTPIYSLPTPIPERAARSGYWSFNLALLSLFHIHWLKKFDQNRILDIFFISDATLGMDKNHRIWPFSFGVRNE